MSDAVVLRTTSTSNAENFGEIFMVNENFRENPFSNVAVLHWPSIFLRKYLPFSKYIVHCSYFWLMLKHVKNFPEAAAVFFRLKKSGTLHFRDGTSCSIWSSRFNLNFYRLLRIKERRYPVVFSEDLEFARFKFLGRQITLQGIDAVALAACTFFDGEYSLPSNAKGRQVVDIGANIGDTAIYFALNGASRVIALEPQSYAFEMARRNIRASGLSEKIILSNTALLGKDACLHMRREKESFGESQLEPAQSGVRICASSMHSLAEKYGLSGAVLKMDCEGCEYEAVLGAGRADLRRFSFIILEYHYGYENLRKKLESCGFSVRIAKGPNYGFQPKWKMPHSIVGILEAVRKPKASAGQNK